MEALRRILSAAERVAVAFSGGVDSTFLLAVACETLGKGNVLAVTATGPVFPRRERLFAERFAAGLDVPHVLVPTWDIARDGPYVNAPDRCYRCKAALFEEMTKVARERGFRVVVEGTNASDLREHRPGLRALRELSVGSPLLEAGLEKEEVRSLSKDEGLPTWDRPSTACLATRLPYGALVREEALKQVELAEEFLLDSGYRQVRVRHHGDLARIEVAPEEIPRLVSEVAPVVERLKALGFRYVALDLQGYRTGSMDEAEAVSSAKTGQEGPP